MTNVAAVGGYDISLSYLKSTELGATNCQDVTSPSNNLDTSFVMGCPCLSHHSAGWSDIV